MLSKAAVKKNKPDLVKTGLISISFLLSIFSVIFFLAEAYILILLSFGVLVVLFVLSDLKKYILYSFIGSMFFGTYLFWPLRIQVLNLVVMLLFFYFFVNWNTGVFNSFRLPKSVKITSSLLLFSIILSLFRSPHFSIFAVYLTLLFFAFVFSGYIIFRFIHNTEQIENYIKYFLIFTAISGVIIIVQIIISGRIRSVGLAGYAIMDISAMALVTLVLMYFLLGKANFAMQVVFIITLIILITTLSRFAWLGFTLSLIYGLIISFFYTKQETEFIKNKILMLLVSFLLGLGVIFITGLHSLIIERFSDVSLSNLFTQTDDKEVIQNSLETRILIWIVAWNAFTQNLWTGIGYQMFFVVSESYNVFPQILYDSIVSEKDAHTTYLNFITETGIIGALSFLAFVVSVFRISFISIKYSINLYEKRISIVLNTLVFFIMIHSIYSGAFTFGQNAFSMYFIFGLVVANYVILKKRNFQS